MMKNEMIASLQAMPSLLLYTFTLPKRIGSGFKLETLNPKHTAVILYPKL
jgi:hypothetical protein